MALILVVEDDPEINSLMALTLRVEDYDVIQARDGEQALKLVQDRNPDLILLDVMMPRMSGYEVAQTLQDRPSSVNIPIIFVTAKAEMEDRVTGLEMAVDYVCKPFAAPELLARVRAALRMRKLQEELRVSNEQLSHLAITDSLTGLCNRRHFDSQLEDELRRAQRFGNSLSIVMFDLDRFKPINDNWGHAQGDIVLQAFGDVLQNSSRRIDTVARIGGEEFASILPATEEVGARSFAEKVRATVEALKVPLVRPREDSSEESLRVTVSGGIAVARKVESEDARMTRLASTLVQAADRALYEAKEGGRNRIMVHSIGVLDAR
ncbi:MAG TPA: diguanylate cyclase [Abditibacteriaceae bacterium]|jgi:diguanylate cyclase (GGDEF)-like protein